MGALSIWRWLVVIGVVPNTVFGAPLVGTFVILNPDLVGVAVAASRIWS